MRRDEFDVVVIGGGPAGYAAALRAAAGGLAVALVERDAVGGTCLHRGCIPAKQLLETAAVLRTVGRSKEFGVLTDLATLDFGAAQERKKAVVGRLHRGLAGLLRGRKVTVVQGSGSVGSGGVVTVEGGAGSAELGARHVVLATGAVPAVLEGFEPDGRVVLTSDHVLDLGALPRRAAIVGAGAVGCEFASLLADLGREVVLLEAAPSLLPGCDPDVTAVLESAFRAKGIEVRTGVTVHGHEPTPDGERVSWSDGSAVVDAVIVSVGRRPAVEGLGLDAVGVAVDERGHVIVDERCRTSGPGLYAVGDLIGTPALAHVGFAEGMLVGSDLAGAQPQPIDYAKVPWTVYCHPEVAFVGLSEEAARRAGFDVTSTVGRYAGNGRAQVLGELDGLVKIVAERQPDGRAGRVLGVHAVGPWVTEQLGAGYMAVAWDRPISDLAAFVQPHPSLSEVLGEAALAMTGAPLHR